MILVCFLTNSLVFFLKATLKYAAVAACFGNYKLSAQVVEHIWKTLWNYKFGNSWFRADSTERQL